MNIFVIRKDVNFFHAAWELVEAAVSLNSEVYLGGKVSEGVGVKEQLITDGITQFYPNSQIGKWCEPAL